MDSKWLAVCLVGLATAMFSPLIMSEHGKSECRIEAIKAHMDADKIVQVCGK
jgi:hypothetical protein